MSEQEKNYNYPNFKWQAFGKKNFNKYLKKGLKEEDGFCWPDGCFQWYCETEMILKKNCFYDHSSSKEMMNYIIYIFRKYLRGCFHEVFFCHPKKHLPK